MPRAGIKNTAGQLLHCFEGLTRVRRPTAQDGCALTKLLLARINWNLLPSPLWGRGWPATGAFISRGGTGEGVKNCGDSSPHITYHQPLVSRFLTKTFEGRGFHFCILHFAFCLARPPPPHSIHVGTNPLTHRLAVHPLPQGGEGRTILRLGCAFALISARPATAWGLHA